MKLKAIVDQEIKNHETNHTQDFLSLIVKIEHELIKFEREEEKTRELCEAEAN